MAELRQKVTDAFKSVQVDICDALAGITGQSFLEEAWDYDTGSGGGITRVFAGEVIEKGGVNYSGVEGELPEKIAERMELGHDRHFFAAGVSLVLHPKNPFVPTVHMNIRYLERGDKAWFGGGIDLTPYYPFTEDIIRFHRSLKEVCDRHDRAYYPRFKRWCDEYFFIKHRDEARGVGGIFFDYLTEDPDATLAFAVDVGRSFLPVYLPILEKRRDTPYTDGNREFQLYRRGRYVEFNLVYDRGTLFGLETGGRIESILMSLPPLTAWTYNWQPEAGSREAEIYAMLKPRDWAGLTP